jgi:hypothetical protein
MSASTQHCQRRDRINTCSAANSGRETCDAVGTHDSIVFAAPEQYPRAIVYTQPNRRRIAFRVFGGNMRLCSDFDSVTCRRSRPVTELCKDRTCLSD